jgi:hypothetical protein
MRKPPRRPTVALRARDEWFSIALAASLQPAVTLGVFVWALHHRDLLAKVAHVIELVRGELPGCCRQQPVSELGE